MITVFGRTNKDSDTNTGETMCRKCKVVPLERLYGLSEKYKTFMSQNLGDTNHVSSISYKRLTHLLKTFVTRKLSFIDSGIKCSLVEFFRILLLNQKKIFLLIESYIRVKNLSSLFSL